MRAYINGDDGAASVTQAAAIHVVPIYDLRTAFSFPFKPQTVIGTKFVCGSGLLQPHRMMGISGTPAAGLLH
jgi:hypothetical protein